MSVIAVYLLTFLWRPRTYQPTLVYVTHPRNNVSTLPSEECGRSLTLVYVTHPRNNVSTLPSEECGRSLTLVYVTHPRNNVSTLPSEECGRSLKQCKSSVTTITRYSSFCLFLGHVLFNPRLTGGAFDAPPSRIFAIAQKRTALST